MDNYSENFQQILEANNLWHSPRNAHELEAFLDGVHEHINEVKGFKENATTGCLEVELICLAQDQFLPIYLVAAKGKQATLRLELDKVLNQSTQGFPPSVGNVHDIWNLLDNSAATR